MLAALHIENVAVIKELDLDFSSGLSVMTGETGAGKSIIIGSVRMLLGARTDKDMIRSGEERALVEGLFSEIGEKTVKALENCSVRPDENGEITLLRSVTAEGRSNCKINGRTVALSQLKAVGELLIGIHGQHDTQTLLNADNHLLLLDRYGDCGKQFEIYRAAYGKSMALKSRLTALIKEEGLRGELREKSRRAYEEISKVKPKAGEDEQLEQRRKLVKDAQKLAKQSRIVYRALYKNEKSASATDLIGIAQTAIEQLSDAMPNGEDCIGKLTACKMELEEIARDAFAVAEICTDNPAEELNRIEDRLDLLKTLKRKYGDTLEEVIAYAEKAKNMLTELDGREDELKMLKSELERSVEDARREGAKLSLLRRDAARRLGEAVNGQMRYLDLEKVVFEVEVTEEHSLSGAPKLTGTGVNTVRFLISANPGEPLKPISEIASGGELSRIMLALKVALADKEETPSLIFDEIDAGISGKTSQKIGIKLREISSYTQVFCITHSAQVAACGHHHFRISKTEVDGRNRTEVALLDESGRVEELARIMGGIHISNSVKESALELLLDGQKDKNESIRTER